MAKRRAAMSLSALLYVPGAGNRYFATAGDRPTVICRNRALSAKCGGSQRYRSSTVNKA